MFCDSCGLAAQSVDQFCARCGAKLAAAAGAPGQVTPAPGVAAKEQLLREIEQVLSDKPRLQITRGGKGDLEIKGELANAGWLLGRKKVEYSARLTAQEDVHTVVYWEEIKSTSWGIPTFGGFEVQTYKTDSKTRSGSVHEAGYVPSGKTIDYKWDYAEARRRVEEVTRACGWQFTVTLRPGTANR